MFIIPLTFALIMVIYLSIRVFNSDGYSVNESGELEYVDEEEELRNQFKISSSNDPIEMTLKEFMELDTK